MPDLHHSIATRPDGLKGRGSPDAWLHAIARLMAPAGSQPEPLPQAAPPARVRGQAPIVSIIERPSVSVAVVSWRDATQCCYGDQLWSIGLAREAGVCVLSGRPIARADMVYRPQRSRRPALNADAMILAAAMDEACGITPAL